MFRSIQPCSSLHFLILPAQSCRKTGRASPRIEGSTDLTLRRLVMMISFAVASASVVGARQVNAQTDIGYRPATIPSISAHSYSGRVPRDTACGRLPSGFGI
jgi:hypothetical protein